MLFYYLTHCLVLVLKLIIAEHSHRFTNNHDNIISISSVLGTKLLFNTEIFTDNQDFKTIIWYKGITNLISLVDSHSLSSQSRFQIINQTKLLITQTFIGDEGFYTLKIQEKSNIYKQYLYHVILFTQNLSFTLSPSSSYNYQAEQKINFTCSISFFANHIYIEQYRSLFFSIWYMIIYNNDPDDYQLLSSSSSSSYTYIASLLNYELNRNDHNQTISCLLIEQQSQQILIHNITLINQLNIKYKAYLYGNYYFIRSFNTYSSIEINCEEFNGNPKPVYTLLWLLNEYNQTLLNKTKSGRYFIQNATWKNRGIYTCLAENDLNNHQPVYQSFRLNIWFNEHQLNKEEILPLQQISSLNENQLIILIIFILIFIFACFLCILSFYCFCLQIK